MKSTLLFGLMCAAQIYAQEQASLPSQDPAPVAPTTISEVTSSSSQVPVSSSSSIAQTNISSSSEATTPAPAASKASDEKSPTPVTATASANSSGTSAGISAGSLSISQIDANGSSATRIAWRPEFSLGKFGIALDLELFLQEGQISAEGWRFGTTDEVLNTLYRKIYYVRWDKPGAPFYARAGALEGINLDAGGLITRNYGNTALYPTAKPLGTHVQFNDWTPLGLDLEAFTNSWQVWNNKGGVLGLRTALRPLKSTGIPILGGLKIGANFVKDFNQFASVSDKDKDGCPDVLDAAPNNASTCSDIIDGQELIAQGVDSATVAQIEKLVEPAQKENDQNLKGQYGKANSFAMIGFDANLPVISTSLLAWDFYSALAFATRENELLHIDDMGFIPLGSKLHVGILDAKLEYRHFMNYFKPGHFNSSYDINRAIEDSLLGKKAIVPYGQRDWAIDLGERAGIFGEAGLDLGGFVNAGGEYSHMFQLDSDKDKADRSYGLKVSLGNNIVNMIPRLAEASAFYNKDHIGLGINRWGNSDSFFDLSSYTRWGYKVGVKASENFVVSAVTHVSYVPNGNGLNKIVNSGIETSIQF